jgi:hypothetical protein
VDLVAKEYGINSRTVKRLLRRARAHGIEGVLHSNKLWSYFEFFKLEVVKCIEDVVSVGCACEKYNLTYTIARSWYHKSSDGGTEALFSDNTTEEKKCRRHQTRRYHNLQPKMS